MCFKEKVKVIFNDMRIMKALIEFSLFLVAAFLGAVISRTLINNRIQIFIATVSSLIILLGLIIFRNWYIGGSDREKEHYELPGHIHDNVKLIYNEIKEHRNRIEKKRNIRFKK